MRREELSIRAWKRLGEAELGLAVGGLPKPTPLGPLKTPTWKYIDGTPGWAIANAIAAGYEVEHID